MLTKSSCTLLAAKKFSFQTPDCTEDTFYHPPMIDYNVPVYRLPVIIGFGKLELCHY